MPKPPRVCYYVGIDPGQSGGIVIMSSSTTYRTIQVEVIPATERDIWELLTRLTGALCTAVIEKVHSMPGQGVASTFKFGVGYGGLRMALIAAGIPFEEVTPRSWQKALGIPPKKKAESNSRWKNRLKAKAQQLFPRVEGITLKTADALLIAEYCRRKHEGLL